MEIVTICSTKGGVGKTTISYNFGEWLAANGNQVLLIDLDQQCNLSQLYGLESTSNNIGNLFDKLNDEEMSVYHTTSENIDIIPGYKKLHRLIANIETDPHKYFFLFRWFRKNYETVKKYDYVIVDCHPSFDTLVKNAVAVSDVLFCPITPTEHGYDAKFTFMDDFVEYKESEAIDMSTEESYVRAKVYYIGNMVKHNTESSRNFLKIIENNPEVIAVLPNRELFNRSTLEHTPLVKMERSDESKYKRYASTYKEIDAEFKKMLEAFNH
ncbi:ParA family protein [Ligilactobacillus equi]|uniref:AAA domain-containing protein n=1 Tax=Ligilactobacillus equi DPC 6820 TaxID=1392007 RepID=V7HXH3_9LACO|nr:ParA family protein [Ligilactobacillus equi]ETA74592.1 hypothetical protein LEQ_0457c [Ligilactobacillus equi DPC 6820]